MPETLNDRIKVVQGDITQLDVDAIVNAANSGLLGGGGVDGAIHRAAGARLVEECRGIGGCPTGEARITDAYDLPARFVIHTVGPVWKGGENGEPKLLADCYRNSLALAVEKKCRTIAFPAISTGVYSYPPDQAAHIAVGAIAQHLSQSPLPEKVILCAFDKQTASLYRRELENSNAA